MRIFTYIAAIIICTACVKETTFELDQLPSQAVANCIFSPKQEWQVAITKSLNTTDVLNYEVIDNATVSVQYPDGSSILLDKFVLPEKTGDIGYYTTEEGHLVGDETDSPYRLSVEIPNLPEVNAISSVPKPPNVLSNFQQIQFVKVSSTPYHIYNLQVQLSLLLAKTEEQHKRIGIRFYYLTDFSPFSPNNPVEPLIKLYTTPDFGDNVRYNSLLDAVIIDATALAENEGEFTALIDNNIVFHNDVLFDRQLILEVFSMSEAYFEYATTSDQQRKGLADPFVEPSPVFNNIEGGLGIFGSYNIVRDTFLLQ